MSAKKTAYDVVDGVNLEGRVFLVTGPYAGLGAETTKALLRAGANVVGAGRNADLQAQFTEDLRSNPQVVFEEKQLDTSHILDLADLKSVAGFAKYVEGTYDRIDCLINNAGVMNTPPGQTQNGFEIQMGVNVIGHFLLAKMLVQKTHRQVWLSSKAHTRYGAPRLDLEAITHVDEEKYHPRKRYQQSKLGSILLAKQFGAEHQHLKSVSVHPGVVATNIGRHVPIWTKIGFMLTDPLAVMAMSSPDVGASTQTLVATMPDSDMVNGAYYADCTISEEAESARNMADAKRLYDFCDHVTQSFQR